MIITATDIRQTFLDLVQEAAADRVFILADETTSRLCLPAFGLGVEGGAGMPSCASGQPPVTPHLITIPAGDDHKNLQTLSTVWTALTEQGATRHSLLINVGGGVVTDIGGFAAATFKRGIRYINFPTTLLAMVDAATGGKTGINFAGLKNEIGAFHQPQHVVLWAGFLTTLDKENLLSGMAEMFKHILIGVGDGTALAQMTTLVDTFSQGLDATHLIRQSVGIKEHIVAEDPTERGLRKALNFGHTIGHAIESLLLEKHTPVLHGYAVAWGMIGELFLSHAAEGLPIDILRGATRMFNELYGPCPISCHDYERLYALMRHDKKNLSAAEVRFVLLAKAGDIRLDRTASRDEIFEALDFIREG